MTSGVPVTTLAAHADSVSRRVPRARLAMKLELPPHRGKWSYPLRAAMAKKLEVCAIEIAETTPLGPLIEGIEALHDEVQSLESRHAVHKTVHIIRLIDVEVDHVKLDKLALTLAITFDAENAELDPAHMVLTTSDLKLHAEASVYELPFVAWDGVLHEQTWPLVEPAHAEIDLGAATGGNHGDATGWWAADIGSDAEDPSDLRPGPDVS